VNIRLDLVGERLGLQLPPIEAAVEISGIAHDSRVATPGVLFCCVPGQNVDGHEHAPMAVERGAAALLVERRLNVSVPQMVVRSVREAMGPAAAAVYRDPSARLPVVGITGTNGKTTTVRIIASVLRELGVETTEIGTLTGARTTPEAPELQQLFRAALDSNKQAVAMEVSSHALDQHRVDGTRFRVAGFTNLGVDHLDHHGTIEEYFLAKQRLFSTEFADVAVIDTRGPWGQRLAAETELPFVAITDAALDGAQAGPRSSTFTWRGVPVALPLGGIFNVANALLAAEVVLALGYDPDAIANGLRVADAVPGRFETIDEGQAFTVVVDYAHTPDGLEAVLEAARAVAEKSLVVVFGAGGDRDRSKRPQMGEVARRLADRVVVTSDNPRGEAPEVIISGIVSGMDSPPELIELDRHAAIRHAIAGARKGDVVLIAGKGHESTQTIGDTVIDFDDRDVARSELRRLGGRSQ
jgi:UDP-N-acetylmuramoyl-L-alanyl-D-glutamate--2,6-diaminopimelate ligase